MANSPGVYTKEKDLTFNIQSITSNASGYVGLFRWGPVDEVVSITTNESELVQRFGQPDNKTSPFFHAAANYLLYSTPLLVVRAMGNGAQNATSEPESSVVVKNIEHYDTVMLDGIGIIGRYPGELGNSIMVSCADSTSYVGWKYKSEFEYFPAGDQFNMVVVDVDGMISGSAGTVLERYELMSKTKGAKKTDGTTAYVVEAVKRQSQYILIGDETEINFTIVDSVGIYERTLNSGADDNEIENADFVSAWDLFANTDDVEMTRVFTSFSTLAGKIRAIDMCESRTDSVAFVACELADIYNTLDRTNNLITYFGTTLNKPTSYSFQCDNWKMVYDKYNDNNIWIPTDSDTAGLHARVFVNAEPWFSMAGLNRGQLKNVIKLAWTSNQTQRDVIYPYSINSIVAIKGEGTVLFGDKTALMAPSAFRHINVRTLFIVIKKAISRAARYQLFELNDFITQSLFRNATDRYLDNIKSRRGIYDKRVVCDSTNNTPQVVDSNEFVGDIYVKPARSINAIKLNFIAVGTGVSFEEVEGA